MPTYTDATLNQSVYTKLPIETFNKIVWKRGDDTLDALLDTDPGRYLGEFRSKVTLDATDEHEEIILPVLPFKVVTRKSGRTSYQLYSATEMLFRPMAARLRYVLYERDANGTVKDARGRDKILAITKKFAKGSGFTPHKEVFGMTFDEDGQFKTYALLSINSSFTFYSYNSASMIFEGKKADGKMPIYRIGTRGVTDEKGNVFPKTKKFNNTKYIEVEALNASNVMFVENAYLDKYWLDASEWANCSAWNAEKNFVPQAKTINSEANPVMTEFLEAALSIGLNDVDIAKIIKDNNGDYSAALNSIRPEEPEFMQD